MYETLVKYKEGSRIGIPLSLFPAAMLTRLVTINSTITSILGIDYFAATFYAMNVVFIELNRSRAKLPP